jgi:enoyl-CoA hydratase/carnithine racemase
MGWTIEVEGDVAGLSLEADVLDEHAARSFVVAAERVTADSAVKGVVVCIDRPVFSAPAADTLEQMQTRADAWRAATRAVETCGKPVVAAISASALDGGFAIALACHYRIAADDNAIRLGFPAVRAGLMPGAGGTQRLARMIGAERALPLLLEGRTLTPDAALKSRIIDVAAPASEVSARAVDWVRAATQSEAVQPWDVKGFAYPGADPRTHTGGGIWAVANAMQRKSSYGNYPALDAIMGAVYDAWVTPMDVALRIEGKYLRRLLRDPRTAAMFATAVAARTRRDPPPPAYVEALRTAYAAVGVHLLDEGTPPALIENAGRMAGFADGALATADALGLELFGEIAVAGDLLREGRRGAASGRGFYEYRDGKTAGLWHGLRDRAESDNVPDAEQIRHRLLSGAAEAAGRALADASIADETSADVFGVAAGYPGWTGGPVRWLRAGYDRAAA